jgi:hypothetical protein
MGCLPKWDGIRDQVLLASKTINSDCKVFFQWEWKAVSAYEVGSES